MTTIYRCAAEHRRQLVAQHPTLNGIDYLEVVDSEAPAGSPRQRTLLVRFLKPIPPALSEDEVALAGGVRVRGVQAEWAFRADLVPGLFTASPAEALFFAAVPDPSRVLVVRTGVAGDFSSYTLSIVTSPTQPATPAWLDPRLSSIAFSFKVECPDEVDCRSTRDCDVIRFDEPEIDYLARDYGTFRRLMLDRLTVTMPEWRERSPADVQVALVELLANVADRLSYMQDAVATEAYLGTARRRVSVRRHARMLDYEVHEGCNARAWVAVEVRAGAIADGWTMPAGTPLLPRDVAGPDATDIDLELAPFVFETMHDVTLRSGNGAIDLYTWSDAECCLPSGATSATLLDQPAMVLVAGDVLILEERVGAATGLPTDADVAHRQAVRLTRAERAVDPLTAVALWEVEWDVADALTFPLCLSARLAHTSPPQLVKVGVARGNVVLADHGRTIVDEVLDPPPPTNRRYRPVLDRTDVTFGEADDTGSLRARPARDALRQDPRRALPLGARLRNGAEIWAPRRDLLASDRFAPEFVLEMERDRSAIVRFGDDVLGKAPGIDVRFTATYRVGTGAAGNVGAESLGRIVNALNGVTVVRNPLPARGGSEPERMEDVRQYAPVAFRTQERAVTEADYVAAARRHPDVQGAAARFRWTGSWFTVFLIIDRRGGRPVAEDAAFAREMRAHIERFRLAGYDLEIRSPVFVPLEIAMRVCVLPGHFAAQVRARLERAFSARELAGGQRGFFHPDLFTFGQPVYLSALYELAMRTPGVASAEVTVFRRYGRPAANELAAGVLTPAPSEIVRLDNDPSLPERGALTFDMQGGL